MSILKIQNAILHRPWLIHPAFAYSKLPLIEKVLSGEPVSYYDDQDGEDNRDEKASKISTAISPDGVTTFGSWRDPFENALPGSTAVIGITNAIMKYDSCGDYGTKSYAALIAKANRNPNISSVLLLIDSPGGTVDGTMELATFIKSNKKPVVSLIDGMMASAAYWIGSSARKVIAMNRTAEAGSIGTMITFVDYTEYLKKEGITVKHVYADQSIHKNEGYHAMLNGNDGPYKEELNKINAMFLAAVRENRSAVQETALTGKMFLADDALTQGLIDSIGDFDYALEQTQSLAGSTRTYYAISQQTNMKSITLLASHAALLALCGASIEAGNSSVDVEANDEFTGKVNSALEAGAKAAADLTAAELRIKELETSLKAAQDATAKVEGEFEEFKKGSNGSTNSASNAGGDTIDGDAGTSDYLTEADAEVARRREALYGKQA